MDFGFLLYSCELEICNFNFILVFFFLSGLSYWKLDEKEMYHTLPENFRSECPDVFSTKVSPVQVNFVHV